MLAQTLLTGYEFGFSLFESLSKLRIFHNN